MAIQVGDRAPDFSLPTQTGETVTLAQFLGKQPIVLYFYPKDDTPGCTIEACTFRDSYDAFQAAGAAVIGVSSDSIESHQSFASKYSLPFALASDRDGQLRKAFGVPNALLVLPGRVTYVIDKAGIVRHQFNDMLNAKAHVSEALAIVQQLAAA
jgi:peroxiredoxin Q/BCP